MIVWSPLVALAALQMTSKGDVVVRQVQVGGVRIVRNERASGAWFRPVRVGHEVVGYELTAPVEEIAQRFFSVWSIE